eukprot:TRINITY_DN1217_c0_g1_i1.p2 TRINITY_DN1217_c0_g1~~TRINITY_DN1217_c0_g1_i1.p2  ORF type:complete len:430 (-),score=127.21 TRINITY_DN1217_c0_g1_i1:1660-2949(-)
MASTQQPSTDSRLPSKTTVGGSSSSSSPSSYTPSTTPSFSALYQVVLKSTSKSSLIGSEKPAAANVGDDDSTTDIDLSPCPKYAPLANADEPVAYEITRVLEQPPSDAVDWEKYLDVALFVGLVAIGYQLTSISAGWNWLGVFGGLLFNAGFTPFVLSLWALLTGTSMFRRENTIKTVISGAIFSIGYSLQALEEADRLALWELMKVIGPALFEIGALFFVTKFFFLGEDDEKRIERLERELEEARRSPGMGMALSYFYNFVLPTAANIRSEDEKTPVDLEISRGNNVVSTLKTNKLFIFVPRDLTGADMKVTLRNLLNDKTIIQGRPQELPEGATHRPMFVYFLSWNVEEKTCDGLFDLPTIISSIYERSKDQQELQVNIKQEILDFQNCLFSLIAGNPVTADKVKIISIPPGALNTVAMAEATKRVI